MLVKPFHIFYMLMLLNMLLLHLVDVLMLLEVPSHISYMFVALYMLLLVLVDVLKMCLTWLHNLHKSLAEYMLLGYKRAPSLLVKPFRIFYILMLLNTLLVHLVYVLMLNLVFFHSQYKFLVLYMLLVQIRGRFFV